MPHNLHSDAQMQADARLLAQTKSDPEAFGWFYRRHVEWVLAYTARRLGDPNAAADLTSEIFAAALLASGRYDPARGSPSSWLYGIVSHKLSTALRRGAIESKARRRLAMAQVPAEQDDLAWIASLAQIDTGDSAMRLLSELPEDQRQVIAGRVLAEQSYDELAATLHISEAAVRKRVSRGLATLRARFEKEGRSHE